ncbi:MAG: 8-amino-7-oxononanoate synthase [Frankiaceae bacterium]|nr:8-amino-7-oxononanoate synthase [Frankiaceae bacterium]
MTDPLAWLADVASSREAAGLRRRLAVRDVTLVDCASNDYLGLARDARVVAAAQAALARHGVGSTGSRLVTGTTEAHVDLETQLAAFVGTEAALTFSSGYLANLGVLQALAGPDTLVVSDSGNHASIIDACRLSRASVVVAGHGDVSAIEAALSGRAQPRAVVVTDAVFSVDGDAAPLAEILAAARRHGAVVVVDEAHSLGVVGSGRGLAASLGCAGGPDVVLTATLSKAFGAQGGVVLASQAVIDHLVDTARPFIFDTGLAPSCAAAAREALSIIRGNPDLPARALRSAERLSRIATVAGLTASTPAAAVVSVRIGAAAEALAAATACRAAGVHVGCFRPPAVADGVSRLRLTARASMTEDDYASVASALAVAFGR